MTTKIDRKMIARIRELRVEQDRLLQMLDFYGWLEDHGTSWDQIKGLRALENTPCSRSEFKTSCRRHGTLATLYEEVNHAYFIKVEVGGLSCRWQKVDENYEGPEEVVRRPYAYRGRFLDILLKDGSRLILPWPPFPEGVIYNRQLCSSNGRKNS